MTIPTIMQDQTKVTYVTALKKFYSSTNLALRKTALDWNRRYILV